MNPVMLAFSAAVFAAGAARFTRIQEREMLALRDELHAAFARRRGQPSCPECGRPLTLQGRSTYVCVCCKHKNP